MKYLTIRKSEWKVLKSNLVNSGLTYFEADKIIDSHKQILEDFQDKLKLKLEKGKLSEEEAEQEFKEKFWALCQENEV